MVSSVLVVDDDPAFLALAARVLEEMGVALILTAPDADAAIRQAHAERPDAALVDVGLPDRDGGDLGHELAALPWGPRVVLTSTDRDVGLTLAARERDGALPFIPKEELAGGTLRRLLA
jgi:CheY-like chemotaxis protein